MPVPDSPLFRPQAVAAQAEQLLGRPSGLLPVRTTLLVYLLAALATLTLAWLYASSYTRRVTVSGDIQPGDQVLRLYPAQSGVVLQRHVQQGERVQAGQLLFTLSAERHSDGSPTQQRISAALQARLQSLHASMAAGKRLGALQLSDLQRRLTLLGAEASRAEQESALLRQQLELARQTQQRFAQLASAGFVSTVQQQQKERERLEAERQWQAQQRLLTTLQRDRAALLAELHAHPLRELDQQLSLGRAAEALAQELAQHQAGHRWQVLAPRAGVLAAINATQGAPVSPSLPLGLLVPADAGLEAHLYAPSRAIGFIRPGTAVKLRLDAFPYQKFGHVHGTVLTVAQSALQPQEIEGQGQSREALYRIRVRLQGNTIRAYGQPMPLLPAMRLEADLLLDTRRLYEWALEPLYSVSGKW
ncbi:MULTISPECIES: HlyD family secretion protein [unclassified Paludibacterium]|uniref:HlyD family secretion protein n=1 Tax=unclassified Paludibacterium TaxID=2618429 RepID=UPI001C03C22A|nr:HlyD family efflux transporter periplasmic adaptor subunit [Paludibacterium sp. B53371]